MPLHLFRAEGSTRLVAAHRHQNSDGSLGGWVADTANVAPGVHLDETSEIYGYACIQGEGIRLLDGSSVSGRVVIDGNHGLVEVRGSEIAGQVSVVGSARIERSNLSGNALVAHGACLRECVVDGYSVIRDAAVVEGSHILGNSKVSHAVVRSCQLRSMGIKGGEYEGYRLIGAPGVMIESDRHHRGDGKEYIVLGGEFASDGPIFEKAGHMPRGWEVIGNARYQPEGGEYVEHPNGGGFVSRNARVDPRSYVEAGSQVDAWSVVTGANTRIEGGAWVGPHSVVNDSVLKGSHVAVFASRVEGSEIVSDGYNGSVALHRSVVDRSKFVVPQRVSLEIEDSSVNACEFEVRSDTPTMTSKILRSRCNSMRFERSGGCMLADSEVNDVLVGEGSRLDGRNLTMGSSEVGERIEVHLKEMDVGEFVVSNECAHRLCRLTFDTSTHGVIDGVRLRLDGSLWIDCETIEWRNRVIEGLSSASGGALRGCDLERRLGRSGAEQAFEI